ncbi:MULTISPECIES: Pepco domain-containing protein [Microcystis]|uniref:Pepco domain-containing protein n=1 Tax=Microcystis viridis FACHB-1342 TaxID=2692900 RepID=A0ABR8G7S9_MICVR|nr:MULTISPECIES: hypothetical protein [Microcystis]MBD2599342.1 hypothetical protein [Microcystis viridis FACHB-1342]MDB9388911.1 hypothetical protein [Microcystis aeruginosa CS-583]ODV35824.1 hypothetical protein BFG60_4574 [Microcystis aeruginosa NIES-98]
MTEDIATPSKIWIITGESDLQKTPAGARSSSDIGGRLGEQERSPEVAATERSQVDVSKLKLEMQGFLKAMREMLDEADPPSAKIRLDEVELSVEINGEGQVSLFGVGGKAGGKGAMTFKFKRKDG